MSLNFKQDLVACFQQHFGNSLVAVVLFGSRARGDAKPESDYDIFLLDGKVLYDKQGYISGKLQRIQDIIKQAGLGRKKYDHQFSWEWKQQPRSRWELTWEGYRELTA